MWLPGQLLMVISRRASLLRATRHSQYANSTYLMAGVVTCPVAENWSGMIQELTFAGRVTRRAGSFSAVGYALLLAWQMGWAPTPDGTADVGLRDGRTLRCNFSDRTQRTMALGLFEPAESHLVRQLLGPGDTFVDVGAHIGWFTTIAARCVGKDGMVIACEPYPSNAAALKQNLLLNDSNNVRLVQMALGSQPGELSLAGDDSGGVTALDWGGSQRVQIRMTTLDQVAAGAEAITLLKVDVEGWEAHVLRGGSETLARTRHVLIEINKPALKEAGSSAEELYNLLRDSGFQSFAPVLQRGLRRLRPDNDLINVLASRPS